MEGKILEMGVENRSTHFIKTTLVLKVLFCIKLEFSYEIFA